MSVVVLLECVAVLAFRISRIEEHVLRLKLSLHLEWPLMLTSDKKCQVDFQRAEIIHWLCETPSRQFVNNFAILCRVHSWPRCFKSFECMRSRHFCIH